MVFRRVPPESPLIFVLVTDEILGSLQCQWREKCRGWTCDELHLSCLGYADDILLFARSKKDLEAMIADCCEAFGAAGLEVGLEKTHWSSSIDLEGEKVRVRGTEIQWERTLEFIGSMTQPCGHSGCSFRHRMKKATAVFQRWKCMLCNQHLSVNQRVAAYRACVIPSATWISGCWTLTAEQAAAFSAWGARNMAQIVGHRFNPELDFAENWRRLHRVGHAAMEHFGGVNPSVEAMRCKHRLAGHFARFEDTNIVFQAMVCRNLSWWRREQADYAKLKDKFGGLHARRFAVWRWEAPFERTYGVTRQPADASQREHGWVQRAQDRGVWKAGEDAFLKG